jgi:hypothetical protein
MNCHEFAEIVDELASTRLSKDAPDAQDILRAKGLEHASMCAPCAARLEVERAVSLGLNALVREERRIEAPPCLKRELMEAFASRQPNPAHTVLSFPRRTRWARLALAVAATLILGFALFASRLRLMPAPTETAYDVTPAITLTPGEVKLDHTSVASTLKVNEASSKIPAGRRMKASTPQANALAFVPRAARKTVRPSNPAKTESRTPDIASTEVASNEILSAFVPLTYLNNATAMESGIVVRVEVAREKLAAMGLPLNLERAGETIKADIVLGDDGVARAIRLVQ